MSFLSIAFLAGLPLAAAPILLHLFDRRRNVVIEWGAMQFLMEATTRKTSARKLKQWLLLLMRVLAILALVFALARPMLPGAWFGATDRGETILVMDNSMSMGRTSGDSRLWDQAIAKGVESVNDIKAGDFVRVMTASPYPTWITEGGFRVDPSTTNSVIDRLGEVRTTNGSSDLLSAVFTAAQAELQPTVRRRRVLVITDRQAVDWNVEDDSGWSRIREVLEGTEIPTEVDVLEVEPPADTSNLAIHRVRANRTVVGVDQSVTISAEIHNHGTEAAASRPTSWRVGGRELDSAELPSLEGGASREVVWKHSFSETGVYAVSCHLDADDQLSSDDEATVVIEVVDEVPVVVVESSPELAEMQRDAFFVETALGWVDGEPLGEKGVFVPTIVRPEQLANLDLSSQRAIVIPNFTSINREMARVLDEFVRQGGGLWIATGPRTDSDAFNQLCFADGNGVAPLALDGIVDEARPPESPETPVTKTLIDPFARAHPATAQLADGTQLDLAEVAVSRRFEFRAPPLGEDVSVLLGLTNGHTLAVEKYLGRGRVIVQSVPLRMEWSGLARSQSFVVMVQDWLDYLTQPRATRHNLSPGEPIAIHLEEVSTRFATLVTPGGDEIELMGEPAGDGMVFRSGRTILPGRYSFESGLSGDRVPIQVSRDPAESMLSVLSQEDQALLVNLEAGSSSADSPSKGTALHEPLWPALLVILIGLIAGELILSGLISHERFGDDPIAESASPTDGVGFETMLVSSPRRAPAEPTRRERPSTRERASSR